MPARDLPVRPNLEQYKKQAKDLLKRWKSADPKTTRKLADAQFAIAREHGFETWKAFIDRIASRRGAAEKAAIWKAARGRPRRRRRQDARAAAARAREDVPDRAPAVDRGSAT